jgi:hypothetical protein
VIYLDAASHNPRRLEDVLDILQEKELHLRTPLEELEIIDEQLPESSWQGLAELARYSGPMDRELAQATAEMAESSPPGHLETMESRLPEDDDADDLLAFLPDYEQVVEDERDADDRE